MMRKRWKKTAGFLSAAALILSALPVSVLAEEQETAEEQTEVAEETAEVQEEVTEAEETETEEIFEEVQEEEVTYDSEIGEPRGKYQITISDFPSDILSDSGVHLIVSDYEGYVIVDETLYGSVPYEFTADLKPYNIMFSWYDEGDYCVCSDPFEIGSDKSIVNYENPYGTQYGYYSIELLESKKYNISGLGQVSQDIGTLKATVDGQEVTGAAEGQEVKIVLQPKNNYRFSHANTVTGASGEVISCGTEPGDLAVSFTMPDEDVTFSGTYEQPVIRYKDGGSVSDCEEYKAVSADMTTLSSGWYITLPGETVEFSHVLDIDGEVNLILCGESYLKNNYGISIPEGAKLTIWEETGETGNLIAEASANPEHAGIEVTGELIINGGRISASSISGAGIGGSLGSSSGTVTINGGTVNAASVDGAGIGGGAARSNSDGGSGGTITINGGDVNAASTNCGAGIGGGGKHDGDNEKNAGSGGTIRINSGKVKALSGSGAGIGGGGVTIYYNGKGSTLHVDGGASGSIIIAGGEVEAYSSRYGAGIGGGGVDAVITQPTGHTPIYGGDVNQTLQIKGGTVTAEGGTNAAGIGPGAATNPGYTGEFSRIEITGGTVKAEGNANGAGIGADKYYKKGSIYITGGTVIATSTGAGPGVGAGTSSDVNIYLSHSFGENDSITAKSYGGHVNLRSNFKDQDAGTIYLSGTGNLNEKIKGKTIVPVRVAFLTFDANGGSGSMNRAAAEDGTEFPLPECTFTPPQRKKFKAWQIGDRTYAENEPAEIRGDTTVKALWEAVEPLFSGHQLVLSGSLGLRFGMEFPADFDETGSYMTFTVNGKEQRVDTSEAEVISGRKTYTCYLNTLQMAEEITAVFHYGDNETWSQTYSLEDYFNYFDEHESSFNEKTLNVVHAVSNYGYFAYPYLVQLHHLEGRYEPITKYYTTSFDIEEIKQKVAQYTFAKGISDSQVSAASYKLSLDSDTALSVMVKVPAGTAVNAAATFNGKTYEMTKDSDTVWSVKIPGIKASQLGDTITVSGTAGGNFTLSVSALSYVRSVLNSDKYKGDAQNAVMALYKYYEAVKGFNS